MDGGNLLTRLKECIEMKLSKSSSIMNESIIWNQEFCLEMLKEDGEVDNQKPENVTLFSQLHGNETHAGLASRPFYAHMSHVLSRWWENSTFPFKHIPFPLLKEKEVYFERLEFIFEGFSKVVQNWKMTADPTPILSAFLDTLTFRDVLSLLGLRHTEGSLLSFPPSLFDCANAFNTLHSPGTPSVLTVGAKAFTKHCHRDQTSSWWGESKGSEANKNTLAINVLTKILNNVIWANIHQLPHNIRIYEVRHEDGYGARWGMVDEEVNGSKRTIIDFRGFLEPQMEDGHSVGWKH